MPRSFGRLAPAPLGLVAIGCGSTPASELPPAAQPVPSPPLTARPHGRVLDVEPAAAALSAAAARGRPVPAAGGRQLAIVQGRERVLELYDASTGARRARVPAGVGPAHAVADANRIYVTDTRGDAVLVFLVRKRLQLTRRVTLPGAPYAIAIDRRRGRLWVTLTGRNQVAELITGGRARVRRVRATVRQPDTVAVDERAGRVFIASRTDGVLQILDP